MSTIRFFRLLIPSLPVICCLLALPGFALAQDEASDTTDAGKPATSIELTYTKSNNRSRILMATVKTKVAESYEAAKGVPINFYQTEAVPAQLLGTVSSNDKGVAMFVVPEEKIAENSSTFTFVAAVENNDTIEDTQEEIAMTDAAFVMQLEEADSARQVVISLQTKDAEGNMIPVAEVDVRLYVQRLFGLLPLSADPETTDENGDITVEFPAGIPGDTAGNLIIVAKVEDHELFGNLEFRRKINWGVPLIIDPNKHVRELWSSRANAPFYLIFIVNAMLIGIWGVIAYIVYQVFLIKKLGRKSVS
jgi:hypothetical protein